MNIFIFLIEKKLEVLEEFFLIIKKILGKKTSNLFVILGITFKMIFNLIINKKYKKKWSSKEKELQYIKEEDILNLI